MNPAPTTVAEQSPARPRRDGMRWWARILAFVVLTVVIGEATRRTGVPALVFAVLAGCAWVALRVVVAQYDDAKPPVAPRRRMSDQRLMGPEPPRTIPVLADSCAICGRTLTNPDSRRAGVGTECIKVHGPRPRTVANPDRDAWNREMAAARAEQVQQQVLLDGEHRVAMSAYRDRLTAWEAAVSSPDGRARSRARNRVRTLRTLTGITACVALAGHFAQ